MYQFCNEGCFSQIFTTCKIQMSRSGVCRLRVKGSFKIVNSSIFYPNRFSISTLFCSYLCNDENSTLLIWSLVVVARLMFMWNTEVFKTWISFARVIRLPEDIYFNKYKHVQNEKLRHLEISHCWLNSKITRHIS